MPHSNAPNLRERHKLRRSAAILAAARGVFAEKGYERASIQEIAGRAEVADATVYNYFGTKGSLLLELAHQCIDQEFEQHWPVIDDTETDSVAALLEFLDHIIDWSLKFLDRDLWRNVYATALTHATGSDTRAIGAMDQFLLDRIARFLEQLQKHGRIKPEVDTVLLAEVVFAVGNNQWLRFLTDDGVSVAEIAALRKQHLTMLMKDLVPERAAS